MTPDPAPDPTPGADPAPDRAPRAAAPPRPPSDPAALDAALRGLHGPGHAAELAALHEAAGALPDRGPEARRFHLTHAWVHALEAGAWARAAALETRLRAAGGL